MLGGAPLGQKKPAALGKAPAIGGLGGPAKPAAPLGGTAPLGGASKPAAPLGGGLGAPKAAAPLGGGLGAAKATAPLGGAAPLGGGAAPAASASKNKNKKKKAAKKAEPKPEEPKEDKETRQSAASKRVEMIKARQKAAAEEKRRQEEAAEAARLKAEEEERLTREEEERKAAERKARKAAKKEKVKEAKAAVIDPRVLEMRRQVEERQRIQAEKKRAEEEAKRLAEEAKAAAAEEGLEDWEDEEDWEAELDDDEEWEASDQDKEAEGEAMTELESEQRIQVPSAIPVAAEPIFKDEDMRSPIICILGHVDTGKTKLLDKIRATNVQTGEAGGITQQIGASFFPRDCIEKNIARLPEDLRVDCKPPGLLIIDTPGHESFTNLRSRGASLCDLAILVIDITAKDLEQQAAESIDILRKSNVPFVIALNKIDLIGNREWRVLGPDASSKLSLESQAPHVQHHFHKNWQWLQGKITEKKGLNMEYYWKLLEAKQAPVEKSKQKKSKGKKGKVETPDQAIDDITSADSYIHVVPTSAISGEGIPDILMMLMRLSQEQMRGRLEYEDEIAATILEVKRIEGLGVTIDVVLTNGTLHEGDTIVVAGMNGPIVSTIRGLLTPQPLKELRVKSDYVHHKAVKAAMGVKVLAEGMDHAVAGASLYVARNPAEVETYKRVAMEEVDGAMQAKESEGVYVMASTLGSLEALMAFLADEKVPVMGTNLGTVHKIDVTKASIMRERGHPEYAMILAFDVEVAADAMLEAERLGVKIFTAPIIYHLTEHFKAHVAEQHEIAVAEARKSSVFPMLAEFIMPIFCGDAHEPTIIGLRVKHGVLKPGMPIFLADSKGEDFEVRTLLGPVMRIEKDKESVAEAKAEDEVAVSVSTDHRIVKEKVFPYDKTNKKWGDHVLLSKMDRASIDNLKEFRADFKNEVNWSLVKKIKNTLDIDDPQ
ncbi:Elongation factor Tu GTP binding domain [Carpediemonas membranifera]|uniref:Eukaryotic translation initiation factor 5B n=1 Tax=Carpediemonas membranifera TaxID=201153 RepID=A0A8J6AZU7_9EUKA|nr:Elongation factor Tu GTP binding domain [Carpediemonas membranifera]|eukprot:KAG9389927.1 Elongation factor Tu GTP binding domain [Carpediemonas membranifera]